MRSALLLALARGTPATRKRVRDRPDGWNYAAAPLVRRLRGQTFAVLGLGRIGLATARRAAAFDMKVIFYDPYLPNGAELAVGYERVRSLDEVHGARRHPVGPHAAHGGDARHGRRAPRSPRQSRS